MEVRLLRDLRFLARHASRLTVRTPHRSAAAGHHLLSRMLLPSRHFQLLETKSPSQKLVQMPDAPVRERPY
jgi:hypothetical protein